MKVECGCEILDEFLPKDSGERVLACAHREWKFTIVTTIIKELKIEPLNQVGQENYD